MATAHVWAAALPGRFEPSKKESISYRYSKPSWRYVCKLRSTGFVWIDRLLEAVLKSSNHTLTLGIKTSQSQFPLFKLYPQTGGAKTGKMQGELFILLSSHQPEQGSTAALKKWHCHHNQSKGRAPRSKHLPAHETLSSATVSPCSPHDVC